jgi:hypothetical protein
MQAISFKTPIAQVQPTSAHVLGLWVAVTVFSLFDAFVFRVDTADAVYVALNIFALLAALALLAHACSRKTPSQYAPISQASARPSARAELTHIFLHVLCVLYLRAALWFELRARG